jgi:Ca2+-binding EF-hand superfamily protein
MKSTRALGLGLAVVLSGAGLARAQVTAASLMELFVKLDKNQDQVVEKEEVPESARPAFEKLLKAGDTNNDGKIDIEEIRILSLHLQAANDPKARFKAMDKDGDGKVSKAEFTGVPANFARFDTNKDGFLDQDEIKAIPAQGSGQPGARIMAMDKDGDGKVSRAEFTGIPANFDRFDTNKDGFLDKDEAAKGAAAGLQALRDMDTNGDGKLSRDEFKGPAARFDQLDANKDGFISFDEIANAAGPAAKKAAQAKKKTD